MQQEFSAQFKLLNDAQKQAVEAVNGPVLVIAGPGTGKTQLLSMRVANILRVTDADASNILCLTFTNKAATNMRDRLMRLVGPESNKVTVKTFHGFAAELMANNPDYFWSGARLSTAPDAIQLETVQNILVTLPLDNPLALKFAGQFTAIDDVLKALRLAKEAGLTPDKLRAILSVNTAYIDTLEPVMVELLSQTLSSKKLDRLKNDIDALPKQGIDSSVAPLLALDDVIKESLNYALDQDEGTGKTKHTGKWKSNWVQTHGGQKGMFSERKRNAWWLAFCDVYQAYRDNLHSRGYYDYSDMLLEVIVQLEQNIDLLADIQERYQYVLIDEFQDSNAAQLRLAHMVASHHTNEGSPNIMAVGDDDQSIFAFNGAELNNLLFFDRTYSNVTRVVLQDNYRSSQPILVTAQAIIEQADDRLVKRLPELTKNLRAVNPPKHPGQITRQIYPTREHQYSGLARQIQQIQQGDEATIAVLARGHESLRQLSSILLELDVPVKYEQQSNVLEHQLIKQVILISQTLESINIGNKELANQYISQLVRHPMWQFGSKDLWQLASNNFSEPDWLVSLQTHPDQYFKQFGDWLCWLSAQSLIDPLPRIIEYIIGLSASQHLTSPLRQYYLESDELSTDYLHGLSAVRLLQDLVQEYSAQPAANLSDFVDFIAINQQNGRGITDESLFVTNERAVELYTVHKAKGLEFDYVFIIDATESNWRPRIAGRKPPANLPLQPPGEEDDDYIRLLYVAATRAKHTLIISSYQFDHTGNEVLTSPFVTHAVPHSKLVNNIPAKEVKVLEENMTWPRLNSVDEEAILKGRLQNYRLSATHLLNFLDVTNGGPHHFLERHLLKLPEAKGIPQSYGSAMHAAMQLAQKLVNQDAFNIEQIQKWYKRALELEHMPPDEYKKWLVHGEQTLEMLFIQNNFQLPKGGKAEVYLENVQVGPACLTGFIDHLYKQDGQIVISDYKTGAPLSSFTTRDQTKVIKAWRHRTQLIFYTLLLQNRPDFSEHTSINSQMIYIEAESSKDLIRSYSPNEEELLRMQKLITVIWQKINNLDFPDITKYTLDMAGILQFEDDLLL